MIKPADKFWTKFKKTNGALSCSEAMAIIQLAALAPGGAYMELGVYKGKSAMSAALTLKDGVFNLVEPEFKDDKFKDEAIANIASVTNRDIYLNPIADYSTNVLPQSGKFCYVMVDSGSHGDGLPMQEVKLLEDRMVQGGIILFHDWNSQFSEVKEASDYLVSTGKYEYIDMNWQAINNYVNENNLEEGNLSWHHQELKNPNFLGAVVRK
jgi:predicted O-methyltransferase YrrM